MLRRNVHGNEVVFSSFANWTYQQIAVNQNGLAECMFVYISRNFLVCTSTWIFYVHLKSFKNILFLLLLILICLFHKKYTNNCYRSLHPRLPKNHLGRAKDMARLRGSEGSGLASRRKRNGPPAEWLGLLMSKRRGKQERTVKNLKHYETP